MPMERLDGWNATEPSGDGPPKDIILGAIPRVAAEFQRGDWFGCLAEGWLESKVLGM